MIYKNNTIKRQKTPATNWPPQYYNLKSSIYEMKKNLNYEFSKNK